MTKRVTPPSNSPASQSDQTGVLRQWRLVNILADREAGALYQELL